MIDANLWNAATPENRYNVLSQFDFSDLRPGVSPVPANIRWAGMAWIDLPSTIKRTLFYHGEMK